MINYILELNAFNAWLDVNPDLPPSCIVLWHALMALANRAGWPERLSLSFATLEGRTHLKRDAIIAARRTLVEYKRISYEPRSGGRAPIYCLIPFCASSQSEKPTRNTFGVPSSEPISMTIGMPISDEQAHAQRGISQVPQPGIESEFPTLFKLNQPNNSQDDNSGLHEIARMNEDVFEAAAQAGFPASPADLERLNLLICEFGHAQVLEAIRCATDASANARNWRYLRGILRRWRDSGGVDAPSAPRASPSGALADNDAQQLAALGDWH